MCVWCVCACVRACVRACVCVCVQVGHALAVAALDLAQANPWSRLPTSEFGCLAGVRDHLILKLQSRRAKAAL